MGDSMKKTHLLTLLRLYSRDRDINSLSSSLNIILDSPIERRLLADIRCAYPAEFYKKGDILTILTSSPLEAGKPGLGIITVIVLPHHMGGCGSVVHTECRVKLSTSYLLSCRSEMSSCVVRNWKRQAPPLPHAPDLLLTFPLQMNF